MKNYSKLLAWSTAWSLVVLGTLTTPTHAVEQLVNGDLESAVGPRNWMLEQSVTGLPGAGVSASEQISFANNPPGTAGALGVFLRPFAGNQGSYAGQNRPINYILSQTVPAGTLGVNQTWTLTADTYFAGDADPLTNDGFSGGVTTLHEDSPSQNPIGDYNENDAVDAADYVVWRDNPETLPREGVSFGMVDQEDYDFWRSRFGTVATSASPTQSTFELAFLDSAGGVIGTPVVLDLRTDRVTLSDTDDANDAIWRTHMLSGLAPAGTTQVRVTAAFRDMVENNGFQNAYLDNFILTRTGSGLDFLGGDRNGNLNTPGEPSGYTIFEAPPETDTVSFRDFANHTTGGEQGMWLRAFETMEPTGEGTLTQTVQGVPGGNYTFSAWSRWENNYSGGVSGTPTETFIKMEFLDASNAVVGMQALDLVAAGQVADNMWRQYSVNGVAPGSTANVRVSVGATGMFFNTDPGQSAFFDDLSLDLAAGSGALAAVPEPAAFGLAVLALCGGLGTCRRLMSRR